jgi:hypothetical protein
LLRTSICQGRLSGFPREGQNSTLLTLGSSISGKSLGNVRIDLHGGVQIGLGANVVTEVPLCEAAPMEQFRQTGIKPKRRVVIVDRRLDTTIGRSCMRIIWSGSP